MHHHDLRRPIVNPRAAVPVIGSAKSVDDVVVVDVSGNCPAAFVSDDTAFFSTTYLILTMISPLSPFLMVIETTPRPSAPESPLPSWPSSLPPSFALLNLIALLNKFEIHWLILPLSASTNSRSSVFDFGPLYNICTLLPYSVWIWLLESSIKL